MNSLEKAIRTGKAHGITLALLEMWDKISKEQIKEQLEKIEKLLDSKEDK